MDIKELLAHLATLAKYADSAGQMPPRNAELASDVRDFITEFREMVEHQQGEADRAKAGIDLEHVSVIHAIEIGLEETHKAHAVVEAARQDAQQRINEAMARIADEKRSRVAEAVFNSCMHQIGTLPEVQQVEAPDGRIGRKQLDTLLLKLAENIANNVAVYATIPDDDDDHSQCEAPGCGLVACTAAREARGVR